MCPTFSYVQQTCWELFAIGTAAGVILNAISNVAANSLGVPGSIQQAGFFDVSVSLAGTSGHGIAHGES